MNNEILRILRSGAFATSNPLKKGLLQDNGYRIIQDANIISAVSDGEGKNRLLIPDRFPESPVVLGISEKKALAVASLGLQSMIWVNDAIFCLKNPNTSDQRDILNKATTPEEIAMLKRTFSDSNGYFLYSNAGLQLVVPDEKGGNRISKSIRTGLRLGIFRNPGDTFEPDPNHAGGFTTRELIEHDLIEPINKEMKFELQIFDHDHIVKVNVNGRSIDFRTTRQTNYEARIPFGKDGKFIKLAQSLALGIVPEEVIRALKVKGRKNFRISYRNNWF